MFAYIVICIIFVIIKTYHYESEPYILTTAKYNFSVYEKRVLYKLIELVQADLEGKKLLPGYSVNKTLFDDKIITIPIKSLLNHENDKNHRKIKDALIGLRNKTIEYETLKKWELIGIIEKPIIEKYADIIKFEVNPRIWEVILNFAKGFRKYELKTAMSFESVYTMRFYEIFSGQKKPIIFTISNYTYIIIISKIFHSFNKNRSSTYSIRI